MFNRIYILHETFEALLLGTSKVFRKKKIKTLYVVKPIYNIADSLVGNSTQNVTY